MKKSVSITIQVIVFAVLASLGIVYILNRSPVDEIGTYEKREMVKPNRNKSLIDQIFSPASESSGNYADDDVSLTGGKGRYDEVRIGKRADE